MASESHWCYSCSRFVLISDSISCPDCDGGFLEHLHQSPTRFPPPPPLSITRTTSNRSPNPVIVLRGSNPSDRSPFQMYYDDGSDSGLRPLPPSMTEFLLGSGFDRLLDQISQIELSSNNNNSSSCDHPPASKSAIEALPVIEIAPTHLVSDSQSHCAVCKETFILSSEAREMPCNHIYHPDCILPWLAIRNSCPVCRHELPAEEEEDVATTTVAEEDGGDSSAGMTIWRLPGGGFAVGRIPGGWRGGMPVVYTEVDGGRLGEERRPRRVAWGSRRVGSSGERSGGFAGRIMRLFGCFSGSSGSVASGSRSQVNRRSRSSFALFRTASSSSSSSRRRHWLAS
ncbi:RING-H2 finger C2A [Raphanus sativus]|uniref:RING-type E3 ubiquitin transferase n=1 Tax=Raphanus sativus TaxID=3726 RepID=A0A6J0JF11_RAPSA|nr:probable E3 ubiquitin-protein ligase RHC2A [Raphanus sativus]KAJ4891986.1 RING-H2 finger C2A [Raphanus sativus]